MHHWPSEGYTARAYVWLNAELHPRTGRVRLKPEHDARARFGYLEQRAVHRPLVLNRLALRKGFLIPGRRVSHFNRPTEWVTTEVPPLRALDEEVG
jgi:hypothetical protein